MEGMLNGVDLTRLADTKHVVEQDPEAGKFRFRARNRWAGGGHCFTTIQDFGVADREDTSRSRAFVLDAGEPDVLLGEDEAPNATEAALYALASCLNTTFIYHAAARGVKIDELHIDLEGMLDLRGFLGISEDVRNGYQGIQVTFRVKADVSDDKVKELCELAQRRSPVFDIVTNKVPVSARVEIMGTGVEADVPLKQSV